jgi:hypothetical protein
VAKAHQPKFAKRPDAGKPKLGADPESYLQQRPVWRFSWFDWDGPWGLTACAARNYRRHIEEHLAQFETMTWQEILNAAGGRGVGRGNNSHHIERDRFTREARRRLEDASIPADELLRPDNCTRIYGVREGSCLRIVWFDPFHCERDGSAAYDWRR